MEHQGTIKNDSNSKSRYSFFEAARMLARTSPVLSPVNEGSPAVNYGDETNSSIQSRPTVSISNNHNFNSTSSTRDDDASQTESELIASRQVISMLQRQIELLRFEKTSLEKLVNQRHQKQKNAVGVDDCQSNETSNDAEDASANGLDDQIFEKDEQIIKLQCNKKELQNDRERQSLQIHTLEAENKKLKYKITSLEEVVQCQSDKIAELTMLLDNEKQTASSSSAISPRRMSIAFGLSAPKVSMKATNSATTKLTEMLEVANDQNSLLKNHVENLTKNLAASEKRENDSRSQCLELEAKCCQIQSKLLTLLKEIEQVLNNNDNKDGNPYARDDMSGDHIVQSESVKVLIKRLLEDKSIDVPLSWKEGNKLNRGKENKSKDRKLNYDELGFYDKNSSSEDISEDVTDFSKNEGNTNQDNSGGSSILNHDSQDSNQLLQRRGNCLNRPSLDSTKHDIVKWRRRWDNFIKDFDNIDLRKSKEIKSLIRSGIPHEYRCKIWKALIDLKVGAERSQKNPNYYQELLDSKPLSDSDKSCINPASKQIELDLLRTLPSNRHFESINSSGTVRLRRVLIAYSKRNPKVGYCQGMNRLAAVALLILPEVEAFWCLVAIVEHIMPENYYTDLWMAQIDSMVVLDFVSTKLPNLHDHFVKYDIELSLFAWFLTIFVDGASPSLYLRLWDCFLHEGEKVLFRVSLAILKTNEHELLRLKNSISVNNHLRSSISKPIEMDSFFNIVFNWTNPLSYNSIKARKNQHGCQVNNTAKFDNRTAISQSELEMSVIDV